MLYFPTRYVRVSSLTWCQIKHILWPIIFLTHFLDFFYIEQCLHTINKLVTLDRFSWTGSGDFSFLPKHSVSLPRIVSLSTFSSDLSIDSPSLFKGLKDSLEVEPLFLPYGHQPLLGDQSFHSSFLSICVLRKFQCDWYTK